ncbi:MAG: serine hydrolase [Lachnospiraceae bacterium]
MRWKTRLLCGVFLFLLGMQSVNLYAAEQTLPSKIEQDQLENEMDHFIKKRKDTTAGMAVAVFDRSKELVKKQEGYVDMENQIPVKSDSVFEWGSASKLLVWVSVMQLYEQEKLDLNKDIRAYLPDGFLTNLSFDTPVTMIHLMNHTAGFQEDYVDVFVKNPKYFKNLQQALQKHEPDQIYEPGTVTAYSNWGVALAGFIVEQISGMSFSDYVQKQIFRPLHMTHSAISADLSDNKWVQQKRKELQCYMTDGTLIPDCFYYITLYPAGMCTSTLDDFERFAVALLEEDTALLKKRETWKELFTPTSYFGKSKIPLNVHGFWMEPFAVQTIGHGGNTAGCSSYLLLDKEDGIGAVVMTNQAYETVYNTEMMELIFGKYERETYSSENQVPEGIYRPARTVRKGPLKLLSLSYKINEVDENKLWMLDDTSGCKKIVYSYGDDIQVSKPVFVLEMGLCALWVAAIVFSVISLLVHLIRTVVRRCQKKTIIKNELGSWSVIVSILQIVIVSVLFGAIMCVSSYALGATYQWMFAVIGLLAIILFLMCIYGFWKMKKIRLKKGWKLYHTVTAAFMVITIANILYWNLFMYWKL